MEDFKTTLSNRKSNVNRTLKLGESRRSRDSRTAEGIDRSKDSSDEGGIDKS